MRAVKCGSIEPACITLLSFESGDQFMMLFIVPEVTVGISILDMTDWDIYRNMTLPVLYVMMVFFFNLKAFSLSIVSSFLQVPIINNKANVERPSIDFKLSNRKRLFDTFNWKQAQVTQFSTCFSSTVFAWYKNLEIFFNKHLTTSSEKCLNWIYYYGSTVWKFCWG